MFFFVKSPLFFLLLNTIDLHNWCCITLYRLFDKLPLQSLNDRLYNWCFSILYRWFNKLLNRLLNCRFILDFRSSVFSTLIIYLELAQPAMSILPVKEAKQYSYFVQYCLIFNFVSKSIQSFFVLLWKNNPWEPQKLWLKFWEGFFCFRVFVCNFTFSGIIYANISKVKRFLTVSFLCYLK